jgi:predicted 3-demethylubiquinone-9 3-methyltransferase (glyoxalase superfamily)
MPTITPFLWYDSQAEEAMNFYASVFPHAKVGNVSRAQGRVMAVEFELEGQKFIALNAGPVYKFTEAVSFFVGCDTQEEIDRYWDALLQGGTPEQCGWLKDRYGLSWQIVPKLLSTLMTDPDREKAKRVSEAMLKMVKFDIAEIERAARG